MLKFDLHNYVDYKVDNPMPIKGKYGFRVKLKYFDETTKVQEYSGFSTKKSAIAKRDDIIAALKNGTYIVYPKIKVADFLLYWLEKEIMSETESNNTYTSYCNAINNYISPRLGKKRICQVQTSDVQQLIDSIAETSVSEAEMCKTILNCSFKYAKKLKVACYNPVLGIKVKKSVSNTGVGYHTRSIDESRVLNKEQLMLLLNSAKGTPLYIMLLFNALMGLRESEIIGVKFEDVSFMRKTIQIKRQLGKPAKAKKEDYPAKMLTKQELGLKTESGYRTLDIPDIIFDEILRLRSVYEKNKNRRKREFRDLGYICCSTYGNPRSRGYHFQPFKALLKELGLPNVRWHDIRHSYCTMLVKADINPKTVSVAMGHAKEIITLDRYTDKSEIMLDCVAVLDDFIRQVIPGWDNKENVDYIDNTDYVLDISEYLAV